MHEEALSLGISPLFCFGSVGLGDTPEGREEYTPCLRVFNYFFGQYSEF
jgi:hypothetical protein